MRKKGRNEIAMLEIRKIQQSEIPLVMKKIGDIFYLEQGIPKNLNYIDSQYHPQWWGAFQDSRLLGTVASYIENNLCHMGRITVEKELRGQHVGTALIVFALNELFKQDVPEVFLDAREITVHIILRLGGKIIGKEHPFYKGTCTPVSITKDEFLHKCESFV